MTNKEIMYKEFADIFSEENKKLKEKIKQLELEAIEYGEEIEELKYDIYKLKESRNLLSEVNGSLARINDKQDKEITKLKEMIEEKQNDKFWIN